MRLEEQVRSRLRLSADAVPVPQADPSTLIRRGRRRRAMRVGISGLAVLALAGGIALPLAGLLPTRQSAGVRVIPGATSSDLLSLGFSVVLDRPPGWTVLVQRPSEQMYGQPVFQLSNFDPGVLGPDPSASWLCPLHPSELPANGVVLIVEGTGIASGSEPTWPVSLDLSKTSSGECGTGTYVTWRAGRADELWILSNDQPTASPGAQIAFSAFAAVGGQASDADVQALLETFSRLRFDGMLQMHYWNSFDSIDGSPYAVLATSVTVTEGTPIREAFPVTMNVAEFSDASGVPQYCLAYFCLLKHPDGTLYELWGDGNGGTRAVDAGDLRFSSGTSCPSGRHQIGGIVTANAASVQLRLDDGRTFEIPTVPTPTSWNEPYRAFWTELTGDANGRLVAIDASGNVIAGAPYEIHGC